jgi:hypothetical protein
VVQNAETPQIAPDCSAEAQTSFNLTQNRCFVYSPYGNTYVTMIFG